jgi:hypothetical protein
MRSFTGSMLAGVALAALAAAPALPQQNENQPNFGPDMMTGWVGLNGAGPFFEPAPGKAPAPVVSDPAHPFIPNGTGNQPSFRVADLTNPNLKPWVKDRMKKDIDEVLAGKVAFTPGSSCMPSGVPMFMAQGGPNPVRFLQTPKEVWMIIVSDQQVRRIYMNVPHSKNPKPSWYGESVGHYEGDTLVVDTIGLNDKTIADVYRTPHTDKMHVIERWRMTDGGQAMEVVFSVEDPDSWYQPWWGMRHYRRVQANHEEIVCAENNRNLFDYHIPEATSPAF